MCVSMISTTSVSAWVVCGMVGLLVSVLDLGLQVAVHEIDLLKPPQALANLLRADLADALDALELTAGRGEHHVEGTELPDHVVDDGLGQAGDPAENPVAARRYREVERVELAVVPEQLAEPPEVEQVLVREARERLHDRGEAVFGLGYVVADERRPVGRDAREHLLELHLDQTPLG